MVRKLLLLGILLALAAALFFAVGCDKLITQVNNNTYYDTLLGAKCVSCHGDDDSRIRQPQGQWANSRHASPDLIEATITYNGVRHLTSSCGPQCHSSEGFIKYMANQTVSQVNQPSPINCFTCHLPHTGVYGSWRMDTLRGDAENVDLGRSVFYNKGKSNMCVWCHRATHVPTFADTAALVKLDSIGADGPHSSAQADIMTATSGNRFGTTPITNTHDAVNNKDGCLACHYGPANYDSAGLAFEFGEHTFRLYDSLTATPYVANCNVAGCHVSTGKQAPITGFFDPATLAAFPDLDSINILGQILAQDLIDYGVLDSSNPLPDTTTYNTDSVASVVVAKILFNYLLYKKDHSHGIHNTSYVLQLLKESVAEWDSVPKASFTASMTQGCTPATILFTNTSKGAVATTKWDFGDGSPAQTVTGKADAEHLFSKAGSFDVTLTVTTAGGPSEASISVALDTVLKAGYSMSPLDTAFVLQTVSFADTTAGSPRTRYWRFIDSTGTTVDTSVEVNPTYGFPNPGKYMIWLKVTNYCSIDSTLDSIYIKPLALGRH